MTTRQFWFWSIFIGLLIAIPILAFKLSGAAMDYIETPPEILNRRKIQVGITTVVCPLWLVISVAYCFFMGASLYSSHYYEWVTEPDNKDREEK